MIGRGLQTSFVHNCTINFSDGLGEICLSKYFFAVHISSFQSTKLVNNSAQPKSPIPRKPDEWITHHAMVFSKMFSVKTMWPETFRTKP